jgi:hypothetical protein
MIEAGTQPKEKKENTDHRLMIRTTSALGADCIEVAEKLGCSVETVVNDILSVGFKSLKILADGNCRAVVFPKDGKLVVESFKEKRV